MCLKGSPSQREEPSLVQTSEDCQQASLAHVSKAGPAPGRGINVTPAQQQRFDERQAQQQNIQLSLVDANAPLDLLQGFVDVTSWNLHAPLAVANSLWYEEVDLPEFSRIFIIII